MIGDYNPARSTTTPVDPELAAKLHFDSSIAAQLGRLPGIFQNLSEIDTKSYAQSRDISAPTLIGGLTDFASITAALHSEGTLAQRIALQLALGQELTPRQAVFVEQIKQVSALLDALQADKD